MLKLYKDTRLGGIARFSLAEAPDNMLVPDEVRKSVVFVCHRDENGFKLDGTAFFVGVTVEEPEILHFGYLVTAKHVIVGAKERTSDNKLWLRVNDKAGGSLLVDSDIDAWLYHPTDTSVDVAILPLILPPELDHLLIPVSMSLTDEIIERESIGPGDEVFFTGLFVSHFGKKRNLPIIRIGNLALMPEEPIATKHFGSIEAYLVEARSIGGLSGSPAFVHLSGARTVGGQTSLGVSRLFWLGLVQGHWDSPSMTDVEDVLIEDGLEKEAINMGIAIVIPATKIMEIINQPVLSDGRKAEQRRRREESLPVEDEAGEDEESITREDFEQALKKVSRPKEQPSDEERSET